MSYLIKDTTEEERRRIVEESLGNLSGACDGCSQRVADMYDAYIRGEMELRDINMAFSTRYVKGSMDREPRSSCQMRTYGNRAGAAPLPSALPKPARVRRKTEKHIARDV